MVTTDSNVLVMYRVVNSKTDSRSPLYNAFYIPRNATTTGISLATVKQHCRAPGSDGYHWRVRVDEKPVHSGEKSQSHTFSWWDVQDENASLPIGTHTQSELENLFSDADPSSNIGNTKNIAAGVPSASGAVRSLGKLAKKLDVATTNVHHTRHDTSSCPRINVVAFKVLDLARTEDSCIERRQSSFGSCRMKRASSSASTRRQPPSPPYTPPQTPPHSPSGGYTPPRTPPRSPASEQPRQQQNQQLQRQPQQQYRRAQSNPPAAPLPAANSRSAPPVRRAAPRAAPKLQNGGDLLNFDSGGNDSGRTLQHMTSSPATLSNETRAEQLKREYEAKKQKQNRVWDEVDQRWVEVDAKAGATVHRGTTSAPPGTAASSVHSAPPKKKAVGIKLDGSSAAGKSANVQAAVSQRVNEMKESQAKALQEVREREAKKKQNEADEDIVRKKLEPKIKAWSEEHGKKKQLRALLSSLHTVLWEGAKWKQVSLGDILDEGKCKRCYHRATLVVHPDKTGHLDAEKRFLAKRIFDALSQAHSEASN